MIEPLHQPAGIVKGFAWQIGKICRSFFGYLKARGRIMKGAPTGTTNLSIASMKHVAIDSWLLWTNLRCIWLSKDSALYSVTVPLTKQFLDFTLGHAEQSRQLKLIQMHMRYLHSRHLSQFYPRNFGSVLVMSNVPVMASLFAS